MIKFVVLTTQRSGATFFIKCLANHPQIACRHETVFTQDNKFKFFSFDRPSSFYYQYRSSSVKRQILHWFRSKQLVYNCLNDYLQTLPHNAEAIGFKVSYNHLEKYPAVTAWIREHNIRVIHLIRRNILKTTLSLATAKKRGSYQSTKKVEVVKVRLPPNKLKRNLTRRTRLIEKYQGMFLNNPYLEISYESFVTNRNKEMQKVLEFLSVDNVMSLMNNDLVKLNPDSVKDILENYEEIARALKGTSYEKYLAS